MTRRQFLASAGAVGVCALVVGFADDDDPPL